MLSAYGSYNGNFFYYHSFYNELMEKGDSLTNTDPFPSL